MKSYILLLALLQSLCCSGLPAVNPELAALEDKGLGAALAQVNSVYAVNHLYRVTRGSLKRVIPVGMNTYDLLMTFGIKETDCLKSSRADPQTCAFRPGFFVPSPTCSSRVRVTADSAQVVSLRCGHDSHSDSSESSEEMFPRGRHHFSGPSFVNRDPAPTAPPPPPAQPGRSTHSGTMGVRPREDNFNNFLE